MKKHLAVLCGVYYPNPSPTGRCVDRYIELLKEQYAIDVISLSDNDREEQIDRADGVRVFTLCGRRLAAERRHSGAIGTILHLLGGVEIKTKLLGNLAWYRRKAAALLSRLHSETPYDAVLSVCSPLAAHAAAVDFKKSAPAVRHVAYTVDPYATASRPRPIGWSLERLKKAERTLLSAADAVLVSEEVFASRRDLCDNAAPLPYTLPDRVPAGEKPASETVDCVYAGRFYADIRNPEPMLRCFAQMRDPRIRLHLYTVGCEELVNRYAAGNPAIVLHDQLPHEEILQIYAQADVLVNVGNRTAEFLPSKTFEYIATGKPILHFLNGGTSAEALTRYPLIRLMEDDTDQAESFILSTTGKSASDKEIQEIYRKHTPKEIQNILINALN